MISFVVPAHNEEAMLGRALRSIFAAAAATARPFEVIVVDDASTDRTSKIAAAAGARVVRVDLRQISAVRNAGARQARGDVLVFLDADTELPPRTLVAALAALDRGAVGGGARVIFDGPVNILMEFLTFLFVMVWFSFGWAAGCFIFARRSAFEAVGGFDQQYFIAEEMYLSRALARVGRFVILRQQVITSGRKTRMYSMREMLSKSIRLLLRGPSAFRQREGLDLWYECGREEGDIPAHRTGVSS
jgi:glycosyltransferase involved in cell wall biosynthesis